MQALAVDSIVIWSSILMVIMEFIIILILLYESGLDNIAYKYVRKKQKELYKAFTPRGNRRLRRVLSRVYKKGRARKKK